MYEPATGRFQGLDSYAGNLRDPQSLHKYLYAHADPVNNSDPTGKFAALIGGLVGGMVGNMFVRNMDVKRQSSGLAMVGVALIKMGATIGGAALGWAAAGGILGKALMSRRLWLLNQNPPTELDNLPVTDWISNVKMILEKRVDEYPHPLTNAEQNAAKIAAGKIAEIYVLMAKQRAQEIYNVEGADNQNFGKKGDTSGWLGNWFDDRQHCDKWADAERMALLEKKGELKNSGWLVVNHWDTMKLGDVGFGFLLNHSYVSVTFDPHGTIQQKSGLTENETNSGVSYDPDFVFDPWQRGRPDVFRYNDDGFGFNLLWPIRSGKSEMIFGNSPN